MASASALQLVKFCYGALVSSLPLEDDRFVAVLNEHNLLCQDTKNSLEPLPTREAKVSYYLDHLIKPELENDDCTSFDKLVAVMANSNFDNLPELAAVMTSAVTIKDKVLSNASKLLWAVARTYVISDQFVSE